MAEKTFIEKLIAVQNAIKAPKDKTNEFGKFKYRSCESILEAAKPHLQAHGLYLKISDKPVSIDGWHYIEATASITDGKETETALAYAREPEVKKGMDESQITGTASSYARKYALGGLLGLDDTKDADSNEYAKEREARAKQTTQAKKQTVAVPQPPKGTPCSVCNQEIADYVYTDPNSGASRTYKAETIIKRSMEKYGAPICYDCMAKKVKGENA